MSPAGSLESSKLLELDLHPLELHFPFKPNKLIKCPLTLTNKTDHHIGFWITPTSSYALHYYFRSLRSPTFKMVEPHSTLVVTVTLRDLLVPPSQDRGKFEVSMVAMGSEQHLKNLKLEPSTGNKLKMDSNFVRQVEELGGQVHRKMLTAVICEPASHMAAAVTYEVSLT
jgi:coatomer subunit beta'